MNKQDIIRYYEDSLADYRLIWMNDQTLGMHYGYWDSHVQNHQQSLLRLNAVVAEWLKLCPEDFVLDAGCGLGGTSFWIAQHIGCKLIGVSITPDQIKRAQIYALEKGLQNRVSFKLADYTQTNFPDNYFDAVFAIETICHLTDKTPFFQEIRRILKPKGRLVVADFTLLKPLLTQEEKILMYRWLSGWKGSNLWTESQHVSALKKSGFVHIKTLDYSQQTLPSSRRLYLFSLLGVPLYRLLHKFKLISDIRLENAMSCSIQWQAKKQKLWGHFLYHGEKMG